MEINKVKLIFLLLLFGYNLNAQVSITLLDSRESEVCLPCVKMLNQKPKEVLFGIDIKENQDVYFSIDNIEWFNKIIKNDSYGISVDLVSEDRYNCHETLKQNTSIPYGIHLPPVFKKELISGNESPSGIYVKIGSVPLSLKDKKIEGNLIIVNVNKICYYTNFIDIDRSKWELLPMGLFTDTLIQREQFFVDSGDVFTYSKRAQIVIPFLKGSSSYNKDYVQTIQNSVDLKRYRIQKIEVRAYSSIEGPEGLNLELMEKRGEAMIQALKSYQSNVKRSNVLTAENWLEFFSDIKNTEFDYLKSLSKAEIKNRLTDPVLAKKMEPILSKERKAIATLYLDPLSSKYNLGDYSIVEAFNEAVKSGKLTEARYIQKEVLERIKDNRLPQEYLNKLEVPQTKNFSPLLNDREVYKYFFGLTSEKEALDNFLRIKEINSQNGYINYNICALKLFAWKFGYDTLLHSTLLDEIELLLSQGIHNTLLKRMIINYNILKCEDFMMINDFDAKDSTLAAIHDMYDDIASTDEEVYTLAKYYSYYSQYGWALEIVTPRISQIDSDENLVFYYLNLLFFHPIIYNSESFKMASLNAINLNRQRYCNFFLPNDNGGASMQLLEDSSMRSLWCQNCRN